MIVVYAKLDEGDGTPVRDRQVLTFVLDKGMPLVGHSWGNDVTTEVARWTSYVKRIVVLGQGPSYAPGVAHVPRASALLTIPLLVRLQSLAPNTLLRVPLSLGFAPGFRHEAAFEDPHQAYRDLRSTDHRIPRVVIHHRRADLAEDGRDERLADLALPAPVILGREDRFYPWAPAQRLYEAAGARVVVLDEVGHSVQVEHPVAVAGLIRDFINAEEALP